jgi:hypothetical protein
MQSDCTCESFSESLTCEDKKNANIIQHGKAHVHYHKTKTISRSKPSKNMWQTIKWQKQKLRCKYKVFWFGENENPE